ncbi:MAG: hypothetical protein COU33_04320 [Candidatus Magasanikbacteria bacterium CG10_big_fil_rev_8_21_14_0_10_43_6]|uniref:Uncharacterized protein n=1 Tax=Candidatus Magasanikbacteria bacterium CG10_big_fil_rev_8_21_14_0_10_43_6 TaxID=1974650 RepID=A0A2M6W0C0_9BACT|nr:MAG: hypothetical protein COU33_04320 [Candidatus Magasanikbacteria bacterium CG10_big_fil_rev_8_21_14_0_10_43_6]
MADEETKKPKRRARAKKASSESSTASTKRSSSARDEQSGGLGVVVVILVGLIIIAAIIFAVQNSKTRSLEQEVDSLNNSLQQKVSELGTELEEQKRQQDQTKQQEQERGEYNLAKTYNSAAYGISIRYPVVYIAQKSDVSSQSDSSILLEAVTIIPETDINKPANTASGRSVMIGVYSNESGLSVMDWLSMYGETYEFGYTEEVAQGAATEQISGVDFYTYRTEAAGEIHYIALDGTNLLHLVGMDTKNETLDDIETLTKAMLETLKM